LARTSTETHPEPLGQLAAGLLFAAYAAVFVVAGILLIRRRDVTS